MKKMLPLLILASTCLTACGADSFAGKYKFMLGKQGEKETRVSVEMELKDSISAVNPEAKDFTARFELNGVAGTGDGESSITMLTSLIGMALSADDIDSFDPTKPLEVPGYYVVSDLKDEKYGNKIKIAFDLGEDINTLISSVLEMDPANIVSNFAVSYCNGASFTLQLPVSITDLQMQLAWYGLYFDMDPYVKAKIRGFDDFLDIVMDESFTGNEYKAFTLTDYTALPGEQNEEIRFGTHPTAKDVEDMNEAFQGVFSNTLVYQKDADGNLVKIGSIFEEITEPDHYFFYPLDGFDPGSTTLHDVFMLRDQGILGHDFSEQIEAELTIVPPAYDGAYACNLAYKDAAEGEWDWDLFMKEPFKFRDFHDIKIELKKE